jgi:hypothetical protein
MQVNYFEFQVLERSLIFKSKTLAIDYNVFFNFDLIEEMNYRQVNV